MKGKTQQALIEFNINVEFMEISKSAHGTYAGTWRQTDLYNPTL